MKSICNFILRYYLKYLAKIILAVRRPLVVAVAGSTNKYFFKEKIAEVLAGKGFSVRSSSKDFNTEIGLPLAVLNLPSGYDSYSKWLPIIWRAPSAVFKKMPQVLVLELGVSDPGEMKKLLAIVKPKIAIITGITQRYLEGFADLYELVEEFEYLASHVRQDGLVILNYDNLKVRELAQKAKAEVNFFSLVIDLKEKEINEKIWQAKLVARDFEGQKIEVWHKRKKQEYKLNRFGQHHIQALLGSLIVKEEVLKQKNA